MAGIPARVWAFDAEWVPDARVGRRLYGLPEATGEAAVFEEMWRRGGASSEQPRPYLKTVLCRVVSIAVLRRTGGEEDGELAMLPLPVERGATEEALLSAFLEAAGRERPVLVGFNSRHADLPIVVQRSVAHGLAAREFARLDYLGWRSGLHVDLMAALGWGGRSNPSLGELAAACGVPGKIGTSGGDVADLWLQGRLSDIAAYNELDVIATYLVWLRLAHFEGQLSSEAFAREEQRLERFLEAESSGSGGAAAKPHLGEYLRLWRRARGEDRR